MKTTQDFESVGVIYCVCRLTAFYPMWDIWLQSYVIPNPVTQGNVDNLYSKFREKTLILIIQ